MNKHENNRTPMTTDIYGLVAKNDPPDAFRYYTSTFCAGVEYILANEGGYSNNKNDRGGETNFGISRRANPKVNIRSLTRNGAIEIYYKKYWVPSGAYLLTDQLLAIKIFDLAANMGPHKAVELFQSILGNVATDGILGIKTAARANSLRGGHVLQVYLLKCKNYYEAIVKRKPSQSTFYSGWLNRLYDLSGILDAVGTVFVHIANYQAAANIDGIDENNDGDRKLIASAVAAAVASHVG